MHDRPCIGLIGYSVYKVIVYHGMSDSFNAVAFNIYRSEHESLTTSTTQRLHYRMAWIIYSLNTVGGNEVIEGWWYETTRSAKCLPRLSLPAPQKSDVSNPLDRETSKLYRSLP